MVRPPGVPFRHYPAVGSEQQGFGNEYSVDLAVPKPEKWYGPPGAATQIQWFDREGRVQGREITAQELGALLSGIDLSRAELAAILSVVESYRRLLHCGRVRNPTNPTR